MTTTVAIATETIARVTSARAIPKAEMTCFETARACYGTLENYVRFIEPRMWFAKWEVAYSDEGYRLFLKDGREK